MKNLKVFKWSYAIIIGMTLGLSGCHMDEMFSSDSADSVDYSTSSNPMDTNNRTIITQGSNPSHGNAHPNTNNSTSPQIKGPTKKTTATEPPQKVTPGPKGSAAPQIPVIQ